MNGARSARRETKTDLASEFRVCARHESGHFLMAHLHVINRVARAINRADQSVDAVTGISVDAPDTPLRETVDDKIANSVAHVSESIRKEDRSCEAWRIGGMLFLLNQRFVKPRGLLCDRVPAEFLLGAF